MGENENRDTKMYIAEPDGGYTVIGPIQDLDATYVDVCDVTTTFAAYTIDELTFGSQCRLTQEAATTIFDIRDEVIRYCPNKRVAHLALCASKVRTRKKNFRRCIKILEDMK